MRHLARGWWSLVGVPSITVLVLFSAAQAEQIKLAVEVPVISISPAADGSVALICSGSEWLGSPGEPAIPWRVLTVLLPADARPESVAASLEGAQWASISGTQRLQPIPPIATWDGMQLVAETSSAVAGGNTIYATDAFWPAEGARLLSVGALRKWRLAQVAVPLARYNPVRGELQRLEAGQIVVGFDLGGKQALKSSAIGGTDQIGADAVRRIAANYADQQVSYAETAAGGDSGGTITPVYAIITTSAIQTASTKLSDFVAHKNLFGYDTRIITEEQWGGGTGDAAAENIRSWLKAHYASDGIEYVLLIGNADPTSGDVPMKMLWPRHNESTYPEAPSDFYYSDLTGNWDLDGDGYFGEFPDDFGTGGVDRNWEVLVGRVPYYGAVADVDAYLAKAIQYERSPAGGIGWRKNVLLPMKPSDSSTPGYQLGEAIRNNILSPAGWSSYRIYESDYGLTPPPEKTPCTIADVTSVWGPGIFGLVVYWTHGSSSSAISVMDVFSALNLSNNYPVFTFQVSCENSHPEVANLSAVLLKTCAVSTVGATRVSWYYIGQTYYDGSPSNSGMSYEYCQRVVTDGLSCGSALGELKQTLSVPGTAMWMNFVVFNIYGDPSLSIIPKSYPLTVNVQNSVLGSVLRDPQPSDSNSSGYAPGSVVTLTAEPLAGREFDGWQIFDPNYPGDAGHATVDANATIALIMDTAREVKATFRCGGLAPAMLPLMATGFWGMLRLRRRT